VLLTSPLTWPRQARPLRDSLLCQVLSSGCDLIVSVSANLRLCEKGSSAGSQFSKTIRHADKRAVPIVGGIPLIPSI